MPTVSEILTKLMVQQQLTDNELADLVGIPQPTISRIKNGNSRDPRDTTLRPLADYFGLTISQLRGDMPLPQDLVKVSASNDIQEVSVEALRLAKAIDSLASEERGAVRTLVDALSRPRF